MGFFNRLFQLGKDGPRLPVMFTQATDGKSPLLTNDNAMGITTVYACVRLISDTIGTLPIHVKRRLPDGSAEIVRDHPVARLLRKPNPFQNRNKLLRAYIASEELHGNAYFVIRERDAKGYPTRIDMLDTLNVTPMQGDNDIFYEVAEEGKTYPSRDIIHFAGYCPNGIVGISPIRKLRHELETCMNTTLYSKDLYGGGLRNAGVFSTDQKLDEERLSKLQTQLGAMLNKARRGGKPVLLESGFKFSSVTITPEDAQFVSTKLLSIDQIATAFRVPPHMVGDSTRGTYANNEQGNLEFYIHCLRPKLVELETELNSKLFLEAEQGEYYIDITFEGIIRADTAARTAYYDKMFYIGAMCPNEIREKENLPAYEGGEKFYIPVNMSTNEHSKNNEPATAD